VGLSQKGGTPTKMKENAFTTVEGVEWGRHSKIRD
jgi:hypothetical protein